MHFSFTCENRRRALHSWVVVLAACAALCGFLGVSSSAAATAPVRVGQARAFTPAARGAGAVPEIAVDPSSPAGRALEAALAQKNTDKRQRGVVTGNARKLDPRVNDARTRVLAEKAVRLAAPAQPNTSGSLELDNLSIPQVTKVAPDGAIHVYVYTKADPRAEEVALRAAGLSVELIVPDIRVIQGWLAADRVDAIAALDAVTRITLPDYAWRRSGSKTSEGDALLKANLVRQMGAPGPYTGAGIKVGIISDGGTHLSGPVASGDLPANITTHPTMRYPGDEATAMCEIVYDLAPGAQLYVAGPSTSAEMVTAIQWMVDQGCQVICDDLGFYGEPFFADGPIAIAARNAVVNSGRVYVTAAGNDAANHYQGLYTNSGNGLHDYKLGAGVDTGLDIQVPPGGTVAVILQWDDPFGGSANDYDLYLGDPSTGTIVAGSEGVQNGDDYPFEAISWTNSSASTKPMQILINRFNGASKTLELFVLGAAVTDDDAVSADSVFGHPAVAEVISCATINVADPFHIAANYSSRGPSTIAFPSGQTRQTPFVTGVDGVTVTGAGGFPSPFYGTSASAPHVAAICALMLQRNPFCTPAEIRNFIATSANERGLPGFDNTYGYGWIDALAAVNLVPVPMPSITSQPVAKDVVGGASATFSVSATSPAPLTYQWKRSGVNLPGATGASLALTNIQAQNGGVYSVVVSNAFGSVESAGVALTVTSDSFAGRLIIPAVGINTLGSNAGATKETGEPNHAGNSGGKSVWWTWTAPRTGIVTIDTIGSGFDNVLAVYSGASISALTPVASDHGSSTAVMASKLSFTAVAGNTYQIAVDGFNGASGNVMLNLGYAYSVTTVAGNGTWSSTDGVGKAATFNRPDGVGVDSNGNLFVADTINYTIRKITPAGEVATFAGLPGVSGVVDGIGSAARFFEPHGIAVSSNGTVFVADMYAVRKITATGIVSTVAGSNTGGFLDGNSTAARFNGAWGIAVATNGNLFVVDTYNHAIRKITPDGTVSTFAGNGLNSGGLDGVGSAARFNYPKGVAIDSNGIIYVADTDGNRIRKITPQAVVTTIAGSYSSTGATDGIGTSATFNGPTGLAISPTGDLFISDYWNSLIRKVTPLGIVSTVAGGFYNPVTRETLVDGTGSAANFNGIYQIAVDSSGNFFVADRWNSAIRKLVPSVLPQIQTQPVSQSALVGVNITLSVTATAGGVLSYQWRKNGTPISGATSATLVLNNAQTTDSGAYDVLVMSEGGMITSNVALLTVAVPPAIVSSAASRSIGLGGATTFSVSASGSPPLNYQWRRNGTQIASASNSSLVIAAVAVGDAGSYDVIVTNAGGAVTSSAAVLTVLPNPSPYSSRQPVGSGGTTVSFALEGTQPKHLLLRALGPTLSTLGVTGVLADPQVTLVDAAGAVVASNDNWGTATGVDLPALFSRLGALPLTAGSADAVLYATLNPGAYQLRIGGVGGATGIALIEVYDTDTNSPTRIAYLSTRGRVDSSTGGLPLGLSMPDGASKRFLVRAVGPTLADAAALADPQLQFLKGAAVFASNDNWGNTGALNTAIAQAGAFALPANSLDAAIVVDSALDSGAYTAQVPASIASGDVLLEIYDINASGIPAIAPLVVGPPQNMTVSAGNPASFRALTVGAGDAAYQWRKDGAGIPGATTATLAFNAQTTDAGSYDLKVTTPLGTATSGAATLTVTPAILAGTHVVSSGPGYFAGGTITVGNTITYAATTSSLSLSVVLPSGWSYASSAGSTAGTQPTAGATGTLTWTWTTLPPLPIGFSYTLNTPAGSSGTRMLAATLSAQLTDTTTQTAALSPNPLSISQITTHSADTNQDFQISLFELTRVIELYNTRNGSSRTGCYKIDAAGEDGFGADASRASGSVAALVRYHSADTRGAASGSPRDGAIDLFELTRVIELYNTRGGSSRTGAYHTQANTEDGFAPGP